MLGHPHAIHAGSATPGGNNNNTVPSSGPPSSAHFLLPGEHHHNHHSNSHHSDGSSSAVFNTVTKGGDTPSYGDDDIVGYGGFNRAPSVDAAYRPATQRFRRTWDGVFLPVSISVFGVVLFIRLPYIVGQCGVYLTLLAIFISYGTALLTTISVAAISTNGFTGDGGPYMMISRCLGPQAGTVVGVTFMLANAFSSALYLMGSPAAVLDVFNWTTFSDFYTNNTYVATLIVSSATLIILTIIAMLRFERSFRLLCLVLTIVAIADALICIPTAITGNRPEIDYSGFNMTIWHRNLEPHFDADMNFQSALSLLFPGVTGVMSGLSLSGDLVHSAKAIPRGIAYAWLASFLTYVAMTIVIAGSFDHQHLRKNFTIMSRVSHPYLYMPGEFVASFAAVLSMVGGSVRVLLAMSRDDLFHLKFATFITRLGPRKGIILFVGLVQILLLGGNIYQVASLLTTQAFCATFLALNFSTFMSSVSGVASFRPIYRFFNRTTALLGVIMCLGTMFYISPITGIAFVIVMAILFGVVDVYVDTSRLPWGDASQPVLFHFVRKWLLRLDERKEHIRHWRPSIILMTTDPLCSLNLIHLSNNLKKGGLFQLAFVVEGDYANTATKGRRWKSWVMDYIAASGIKAFAIGTFGSSFREGCQHLLRTSGLGGMRPNTVVISLDELLQKDVFAAMYREHASRTAAIIAELQQEAALEAMASSQANSSIQQQHSNMSKSTDIINMANSAHSNRNSYMDPNMLRVDNDGAIRESFGSSSLGGRVSHHSHSQQQIDKMLMKHSSQLTGATRTSTRNSHHSGGGGDEPAPTPRRITAVSRGPGLNSTIGPITAAGLRRSVNGNGSFFDMQRAMSGGGLDAPDVRLTAPGYRGSSYLNNTSHNMSFTLTKHATSSQSCGQLQNLLGRSPPPPTSGGGSSQPHSIQKSHSCTTSNQPPSAFSPTYYGADFLTGGKHPEDDEDDDVYLYNDAPLLKNMTMLIQPNTHLSSAARNAGGGGDDEDDDLGGREDAHKVGSWMASTQAQVGALVRDEVKEALLESSILLPSGALGGLGSLQGAMGIVDVGPDAAERIHRRLGSNLAASFTGRLARLGKRSTNPGEEPGSVMVGMELARQSHEVGDQADFQATVREVNEAILAADEHDAAGSGGGGGMDGDEAVPSYKTIDDEFVDGAPGDTDNNLVGSQAPSQMFGNNGPLDKELSRAFKYRTKAQASSSDEDNNENGDDGGAIHSIVSRSNYNFSSKASMTGTAISTGKASAVSKRSKARSVAKQIIKGGIAFFRNHASHEESEETLLQRLVVHRSTVTANEDKDLAGYSSVQEFAQIVNDINRLSLNLVIARNVDRLDKRHIQEVINCNKRRVAFWNKRRKRNERRSGRGGSRDADEEDEQEEICDGLLSEEEEVTLLLGTPVPSALTVNGIIPECESTVIPEHAGKVFIDIWLPEDDDAVMFLMAHSLSRTSIWQKKAIIRVVTVVTNDDDIEPQTMHMRRLLKEHRMIDAVVHTVSIEREMRRRGVVGKHVMNELLAADTTRYEVLNSILRAETAEQTALVLLRVDPYHEPPADVLHRPSLTPTTGGGDMGVESFRKLHKKKLVGGDGAVESGGAVESMTTRFEAAKRNSNLEGGADDDGRGEEGGGGASSYAPHQPTLEELGYEKYQDWFAKLVALSAGLPPTLLIAGGSMKCRSSDW